MMVSPFITVDQVHGRVNLPVELKCIIDTAIFQRLRNVKQLGITENIFPSARHSRFEHSIGVCYLAGKMVDRLQRQDTELKLDISALDKLCVQIAGLCHDIGHGPFSHLFESFLRKVRPDKIWKHEQGTITLIDLLRQDPKVKSVLCGLSETDWQFIKECIYCDFDLANITTPSEWTGKVKGRPWSKAFLYDIVSNKMDGFDVDRFDYYLRDSAACGVHPPFGMEDFNRLMDDGCICVLNHPQTNRPRICYAKKVQNELEKARSSRFELHDTVYQHLTTKAIELMVVDILQLADQHLWFYCKNGRLCLSETVDDMEAFLKVDDCILSIINGSSSKNEGMQAAQALYERIKTRDLYYHLGEAEITDKTNVDDDNCEKMKHKFCTLTGVNPKNVEINVKHVHTGLEGRALFYNSKDLREGMACPEESISNRANRNNVQQKKLLSLFLRKRPRNRIEEDKLFKEFTKIANEHNLQGPRSRKRQNSCMDNKANMTPPKDRTSRSLTTTDAVNQAKKALTYT